jgi:hypothetical protein
VDESATPEVAQPAAELPLPPVEPTALTLEQRAAEDFRHIEAEIEQRLAAIEAEAMKWLAGRHSLITKHVDALRKLIP